MSPEEKLAFCQGKNREFRDLIDTQRDEIERLEAEMERLKGEVSRIGKCLELAHEQRVLNARVANDLRSRLEEAVELTPLERKMAANALCLVPFAPGDLISKLRGEE